MGKLLLNVGGVDFLLGNFSKLELSSESESEAVKGYYQDVDVASDLATIITSRSYKLAIDVPVFTQRLLDYFLFAVKLPETVTNLPMLSTKLATASTTADTTITLPVGATVKSVSIANLGQEKLLALTTDYTVATNVVTVLDSGDGAGKRVAVVYEVTAATASKVAANVPEVNKYTSGLKVQWIATPYGADQPLLFVAEDVQFTNAPTVTMGEIAATTLEATLNTSTGTPYYYIPLTSSQAVNLSI